MHFPRLAKPSDITAYTTNIPLCFFLWYLISECQAKDTVKVDLIIKILKCFFL